MAFPLPGVVLQNSISLSMDVSGVPALAVGPLNDVYFAAAMKGTGTNITGPPSTNTPMPPTTTSNLYNIIIGNYTDTGSRQVNYPSITGASNTDAYSFYNSAYLDDFTTTLHSNLYIFGDSPNVNTLLGTTDDSSPSIAVGPNSEVYLAYVTQSSVYGRYNMDSPLVPSFCGCVSPGPRDIVVTRLNNYNKFAPSNAGALMNFYATLAQWRLQDATINSCSDDTNPKLAIDRTNLFLYMVHQTASQILCYPVIGTGPNIILSCLSLQTGAVVWREAQRGLNGATGQTTNPAVAVDTAGGICVAMEITGPLDGGSGDLSGATQMVDVVKYAQTTTSPGVFGSKSRAWVLSQFVDLTPGSGLACRQPTIAMNPVTGQILVAFVTTGTMPGKTRSVAPGFTDLVVVTLNADGTNIRVQQGGVFNPTATPYQSASSPYATNDVYGNFYLSFNVVETTGDTNVFIYKMRPGGDSQWSYGGTHDAYALAGNGNPNAIFPTDAPVYPTAATYSQTPIAIGSNVLCTATRTNNAQDVTPSETGFPGSNGLAVGFLNETLYYLNDTAFNYMANTKSICACGTTNCGCS